MRICSPIVLHHANMVERTQELQCCLCMLWLHNDCVSGTDEQIEASVIMHCYTCSRLPTLIASEISALCQNNSDLIHHMKSLQSENSKLSASVNQFKDMMKENTELNNLVQTL